MTTTAPHQALEEVIDDCRGHLYTVNFAKMRRLGSLTMPVVFVRDNWHYAIYCDDYAHANVGRSGVQYVYVRRRLNLSYRDDSMATYAVLPPTNTIVNAAFIGGYFITELWTNIITHNACFFCECHLTDCCSDQTRHDYNRNKWIADLARVWRIPAELSRHVLEFVFGRGL